MNSSFKISLIVTLTAITINIIFSLIFYFIKDSKKIHFKKLIELFITLPIFLPPSVIGYILLLSLGNNSVIGKFFFNTLNFRFVFSIQGAIIAATVVSLPIIYQSFKVAFNSIEKSYIETAQCLGVPPLTTLLYIYIPLVYPKLLTGIILGFGRAFGEFGATILIAGNIPGRTQTLPLALYTAIESGEYIFANRILIILLIFSSFLLGIYQIFTNKKS